MRILRVLAALLVTLLVLLFLVWLAAKFADGPLGPLPGGALRSGEWAEAGPVDFGFAAALDRLEFQLLQPEASRTTWLVVHEGALYVPCGMPNSFIKRWPHQAVADGRAVIRLDGVRYARQAVRITEQPLWETLARLTAAKYGIGEDATASQDDVWFFRLDPRP